jgi:hypothetical protein
MRTLVILLASCLFVAFASAHDFTTILVGLDGKPLTLEQASPPVTLGDVSAIALTSSFKDENPSGTEKVKRWALALRVRTAKDVELTADDVKLIKDLVAKGFGPLIVGQVWSILDPASVK